MKCVCGHYKSVHTTTGWPSFAPVCESFTCCNRTVNRSPGKGGGEHDFINHPVTRCKCKEFTQQENEVQE